MPMATPAATPAATPTRAPAPSEPLVRVGSKRFTESYILGELLVQTIERHGGRASHRQGLGDTAIVLGALESGNVDLYPEYTGTIAREILRLDRVPPLDDLNRLLAARGLVAAFPLGFKNDYALAMRAERARALGIATISDLTRHPDLKIGLSHEFLGRADGWAGLRAFYDLPFSRPPGFDNAVAHQALANASLDLIDVYTTDAKIRRYDLTVLDDDRQFFPRYDAVILARSDLPTRAPRAWQALAGLEGRFDEATMQALNGEAELNNKRFARVAADYLDAADRGQHIREAMAAGGIDNAAAPIPAWRRFLARLFGDDLARLTAEHLFLVIGSVAASVLVGLPIGVAAARHPALARPLLALVGMIQTIPSLALLAFLIPLTGQIGVIPAFIALVLYALLPIVRNTHAGLIQVRQGVKEAGRSLGLTRGQVLRLVELPMAAPTILAGVKTSAVINVGTATIAAFIGAGGFGERIVTGLALNDHATLLAGAVPAAALALLIEGGFTVYERAHQRLLAPTR